MPDASVKTPNLVRHLANLARRPGEAPGHEDGTAVYAGPMSEADATERDGTARQPPSAVRRRRLPSWWSRLRSEDAFQSLRGHLAALGRAILLAAPAGMVVFFGLGALRFAVDDRTLWDSVAHSVVQFWYVLLVFVLVAIPPALMLVRRGQHEAAAFVTQRGYGTFLLAIYLVIPAIAAAVAFVLGHVLIVLLVLAVLFVILLHTGGF